MKLIEKLAEIQSKLKAPKGQYNSFGEYKYRSCEDILEAVKPIKGDCVVLLSDEVVQKGDRFYVRTTASIQNESERIEVYAEAREDSEKKKMDGSQITGAASSYARKYALNGLFCIDDTKDTDTEEYQAETIKEPTSQPKVENSAEKKALIERVKQLGCDEKKVCAYFKLKGYEQLSIEQLKFVVKNKENEAQNEKKEG